VPGTQWGIFDQSGNPILEGDSVDSFSFQRDARVSTAPQEQGAFASYNKVAEPYTPRVAYAVNSDRTGFLAAVDAAVQSLDLYVVTSPDAVYPNANLIHYDYTRTVQQGVTLIIVNVWLEEIRQGSGPLLQNTQSPNGAAPAVSGQQQPVGTGPGGSNTLLQSKLSPISDTSTNTGLSTPTVGPLNYDTTNLPQVPNTWTGLGGTEQASVINNGTGLGASSALVYPPAADGTSAVTYIGAGTAVF